MIIKIIEPAVNQSVSQAQLASVSHSFSQIVRKALISLRVLCSEKESSFPGNRNSSL